MDMDKIEFQVQNEYFLDRFRAKYPKTELRSFAGWKSLGFMVKKGEKQKAFNLPVIAGTTMDPITGEDVPRHAMRTVYGFTRDQVQKLGAKRECQGHPAGPFDPMGQTVYCDGACRAVSVR
jgi:hypothetical protein